MRVSLDLTPNIAQYLNKFLRDMYWIPSQHLTTNSIWGQFPSQPGSQVAGRSQAVEVSTYADTTDQFRFKSFKNDIRWYLTCSWTLTSCQYWENVSLRTHSLQVIHSTPGRQVADGRHLVKITIYAFQTQQLCCRQPVRVLEIWRRRFL